MSKQTVVGKYLSCYLPQHHSERVDIHFLSAPLTQKKLRSSPETHQKMSHFYVLQKRES